MRIAFVHDWITGFRGGERVLDALATHFPDSELHTLIHRPGQTTEDIDRLQIHTSPLNRLPGIEKHYRKLLPLYPWAIDQLRPSQCDLVLSISHAVAKSVPIPHATPHLCYCLTPMRYIWDQTDAYLGTGLRRRFASPLVTRLRRFDQRRSDADQVTRFTAISREVSSRIRAHYDRPSKVIHPPVEVSRFQVRDRPADDFYLLVGAFVPYKREDLVLQAFRRSGRRLIVAGDGPSRSHFARRAPPNIEFVGRVPDPELADLMSRCRALLHPQREDFGLVAVETQAAGRPVIAFGAGGALDTIRPFQDAHALSDAKHLDPTGLFFYEQSVESLERAIQKFEDHEEAFDPTSIRQHAETFSRERFLSEIKSEIAATLAEDAETQ